MDVRLSQLIEEVCKHPQTNPKRRKALNRLLLEFQQLPGLRKSSHPDYLDALNQTWNWVNQSICQDFDLSKASIPERLVQWINSYLYWRIRDLSESNKNVTLSLDATDATGNTFLEKFSETGFNVPTRSGLDGYIEQIEKQHKQSIWIKLEQYIEEDPEGKLRNCHPKAHPECNCQLLSQKLFLKAKPDKFASLARELNINYQTLKSHWERTCRTHLQEIAKQLGYQPEN